MTVTLFHGDCLQIMPTLETDSFDAIITDPPYGLEFRENGWDKSIPDWLEKAKRIASVVIFTTAPLTMWEYPQPDWVCCWYREASNSRSLLGGFNHWSPIMVYGKPRFKVDSIKLHAIQHAAPKGIGHPTPKPLALLTWIIENATQSGAIILDPFMGSGTTGIVCQQMGRNFVGIEKDAGYFEIAKRRIETERDQLKFDISM